MLPLLLRLAQVIHWNHVSGLEIAGVVGGPTDIPRPVFYSHCDPGIIFWSPCVSVHNLCERNSREGITFRHSTGGFSATSLFLSSCRSWWRHGLHHRWSDRQLGVIIVAAAVLPLDLLVLQVRERVRKKHQWKQRIGIEIWRKKPLRKSYLWSRKRKAQNTW